MHLLFSAISFCVFNFCAAKQFMYLCTNNFHALTKYSVKHLKLWKPFLAFLILSVGTKSPFPLMFSRYIFGFLEDIYLAIKTSFPREIQFMVYIFIKWDIFDVSCCYPFRISSYLLLYILKGFFLDKTYIDLQFCKQNVQSKN